MRGLKENLFMRAGMKKIHQVNIKRSPGQWQKKTNDIPNMIVTSRVCVLKNTHMKTWILKRNGVILTWYKFQVCNDCNLYTIVQQVCEPAFGSFSL